jgi:hypothetical protein
MDDQQSIEAIQERMRELSGLLAHLGDDPEAVTDLATSFTARDPERFKAVLERTFPEFAPPPDKCDPYVRTYISLIEPPECKDVCTWRDGAVLSDPEAQQITAAATTGASSQHLRDLLIALGIIHCERVCKERSAVLEVDLFVQGICPPGSY